MKIKVYNKLFGDWKDLRQVCCYISSKWYVNKVKEGDGIFDAGLYVFVEAGKEYLAQNK